MFLYTALSIVPTICMALINVCWMRECTSYTYPSWLSCLILWKSDKAYHQGTVMYVMLLTKTNKKKGWEIKVNFSDMKNGKR